ncbi:MAG: hypothetical protein ACT4PT_00865, partial [Methanobacteriota archaeon]
MGPAFLGPTFPGGPGDAAFEILRRQGIAPDATQRESIVALDGTPEPLRDSLDLLLDAYLAADAASRAFDGGYTAGGPGPGPNPGDVAALLAARLLVADAVVRLDAALAVTTTSQLPLPSVFAPPALVLDFGSTDDLYEDDVAVLVDAGGNDTYRNNAGGSNLAGGSCEIGAGQGSAVLVDLAGDDEYWDGGTRRGCGVNGGGYLGTGFLFDAKGDDAYGTARGPGSPAGSFLPAGGALAGYRTARGGLPDGPGRVVVGFREGRSPASGPGETFLGARVL